MSIIPPIINEKYACFEKNIEDVIRREIGEEQFAKYMSSCKKELRATSEKDEEVVTCIIEKAYANGHSFSNLESVINYIVNMPRTTIQ